MCKNDTILALFLSLIVGMVIGACIENGHVLPKEIIREVIVRDTMIVVDKTLAKENKKLKIYNSNLKEDVERAEKSLLNNGGK